MNTELKDLSNEVETIKSDIADFEKQRVILQLNTKTEIKISMNSFNSQWTQLRQ